MVSARTCTETWIGKISIWVYFWSFTNLQCIPSRTLTYPTWGKGKSSSNMPFLGGYVNSLEGIILEIVRPFLEDLVRTRTGSECTWTSDSLKKCCINSPISGDRRIPRGSGTFQNNISNWIIQQKPFLGILEIGVVIIPPWIRSQKWRGKERNRPENQSMSKLQDALNYNCNTEKVEKHWTQTAVDI